jgi:hypothetical protein
MVNMTDTRASNRSFLFTSTLTFIAMALMAGRSSLAAIHQHGPFPTDMQRRALDWSPKHNG